MEEETAQEPAATPHRRRRGGVAVSRVRPAAGSSGPDRRPAAARRTPSARHAAPRTPRAPATPGLYRLIELHAFNAAGDAAVAISLAGTLFFANPGEARGQVALFLGLTMLPFAVVAPLLGPSSTGSATADAGRSASTMALRAFLCWLMADAVATQSIAMFPTALGVLVASKAYGVTRAATVPRLQPQGLSLVKANSRISLAGVVGAAISAPAGGPRLDVRLAVGAALRVRRVRGRHDPLDPAAGAGRRQGGRAAGQPARRARRSSGCRPPVVFALRCNAGLRMLSGFLTMYMAFLLRQYPLPGLGAPGHAADGAGDRRRRARQHHRHRARLGAAQGHTRRSPSSSRCSPTRPLPSSRPCSTG